MPFGIGVAGALIVATRPSPTSCVWPMHSARDEDDEETAERLADALSNTTNVVLTPDLEMRYQLLGDDRRHHLKMGSMSPPRCTGSPMRLLPFGRHLRARSRPAEEAGSTRLTSGSVG